MTIGTSMSQFKMHIKDVVISYTCRNVKNKRTNFEKDLKVITYIAELITRHGCVVVY